MLDDALVTLLAESVGLLEPLAVPLLRGVTDVQAETVTVEDDEDVITPLVVAVLLTDVRALSLEEGVPVEDRETRGDLDEEGECDGVRDGIELRELVPVTVAVRRTVEVLEGVRVGMEGLGEHEPDELPLAEPLAEGDGVSEFEPVELVDLLDDGERDELVVREEMAVADFAALLEARDAVPDALFEGDDVTLVLAVAQVVVECEGVSVGDREPLREKTLLILPLRDADGDRELVPDTDGVRDTVFVTLDEGVSEIDVDCDTQVETLNVELVERDGGCETLGEKDTVPEPVAATREGEVLAVFVLEWVEASDGVIRLDGVTDTVDDTLGDLLFAMVTLPVVLMDGQLELELEPLCVERMLPVAQLEALTEMDGDDVNTTVKLPATLRVGVAHAENMTLEVPPRLKEGDTEGESEDDGEREPLVLRDPQELVLIVLDTVLDVVCESVDDVHVDNEPVTERLRDGDAVAEGERRGEELVEMLFVAFTEAEPEFVNVDMNELVPLGDEHRVRVNVDVPDVATDDEPLREDETVTELLREKEGLLLGFADADVDEEGEGLGDADGDAVTDAHAVSLGLTLSVTVLLPPLSDMEMTAERDVVADMDGLCVTEGEPDIELLTDGRESVAVAVLVDIMHAVALDVGDKLLLRERTALRDARLKVAAADVVEESEKEALFTALLVVSALALIVADMIALRVKKEPVEVLVAVTDGPIVKGAECVKEDVKLEVGVGVADSVGEFVAESVDWEEWEEEEESVAGFVGPDCVADADGDGVNEA